RYKVFYPTTLYVLESDNNNAKLLNCVKRGHQNLLEMMLNFYALLVLAGLKHPEVSVGLGLVYIVERYFYFKGYFTSFFLLLPLKLV
ncbi:hypothetical protein GIB67_010472, partial [Kingdonia uniflora]